MLVEDARRLSARMAREALFLEVCEVCQRTTILPPWGPISGLWAKYAFGTRARTWESLWTTLGGNGKAGNLTLVVRLMVETTLEEGFGSYPCMLLMLRESAIWLR